MRNPLSLLRFFLARAANQLAEPIEPKPRRGSRLALEVLPDRTTPAILWANRGSDGFDAAYGANAAAARTVVDQAIADWSAAVPNFNYADPAYLNTLVIYISAGNLGGNRGLTNVVDWESGTRKPTLATIALDDDGAGDGWYFDPFPAEGSEFWDTQNRFMAHNDLPGVDLYRTAAHELGHALGLAMNPNSLPGEGLKINQYRTVLRGVPYLPEYWLYNVNVGSTTLATFTASSHIYGGEGVANYEQYPGSKIARDLMNSGELLPTGHQTRQLISTLDVSILASVYGYTVNTGSLRTFTPATHRVGTYRIPPVGQLGQFELRDRDGSSITFDYLPQDNYAVAGDWDGNGLDEVGSYSPATGVFSLRDVNGGTTNISLGGLGWLPVAGDWNGDGIDEVGVYNPSLAEFQLYVAGLPTITITSFGSSNFVPVAGDWDGDGVDELGIYDQNQALFRIRYRDGTKVSISAGGVGSQPLAGDWDGDGVDTVGTYNRSLGRFALKSSSGAVTAIFFGGTDSPRRPLAGNWL